MEKASAAQDQAVAGHISESGPLTATGTAAEDQPAAGHKSQLAPVPRSDGSDNRGSPRSWHSPEDELGHLLKKRGPRKGSEDSDYIPEDEVW